MPPRMSLASILARFLRVGLSAWGGPIAQIGLLREQLVEREHWVAPERFDRMLGLYQALPGPEALELCVYLGMVARGRVGGIAAGLGFMLPGTLFVLASAWAYRQSGADTSELAFLAGAQIAALALVMRAAHRIGRGVLRRPILWMIAAAASVATAGGLSFIIVLSSGALVNVLARGRWACVAAATVLGCVAMLPWAHGDDQRHVVSRSSVDVAAHAGQATLVQAAATGLSAGSLSFGGAYTAIGFVHDDAVLKHGWLTDSQFLDSLAVSGSLPAPLVVFATFVGYLAGGISTALVMTAAIFLPAFALTLAGHEHLERLVQEPRAHRVLDGVTAAVIGVVIATTITLARSSLSSWQHVVLLAGCLVVLARWRSSSAVVCTVIGSALLASVLSPA